MGATDGARVGVGVGLGVGIAVGLGVGARVGTGVGPGVGNVLGSCVGSWVGETVVMIRAPKKIAKSGCSVSSWNLNRTEEIMQPSLNPGLPSAKKQLALISPSQSSTRWPRSRISKTASSTISVAVVSETATVISCLWASLMPGTVHATEFCCPETAES